MCPVETVSRARSRATHVSGDPHCYIAYAPRGAGLLCAVVCSVRDDDVCGWWTGVVDGEVQTAFFLLQQYFSPEEQAFYATHGGDLYRGWSHDYRMRPPELDSPVAVEDELCHRLEHMQFIFAQDWLWFAENAGAAAEEALYCNAELAHQSVNVKFRRLTRLDKGDPVWTYHSPGLDLNIVRRLVRDWPLECRRVHGPE